MTTLTAWPGLSYPLRGTGDDGSAQLGAISWLTPDGTQMTEEDWAKPDETVTLASRSLWLRRRG